MLTNFHGGVPIQVHGVHGVDGHNTRNASVEKCNIYVYIYIYLDLPRGAEWMVRGAYTPSLRVQTAPFGRCW